MENCCYCKRKLGSKLLRMLVCIFRMCGGIKEGVDVRESPANCFHVCVYLHVCMSACMSVCLYMSVCLSVCLSDGWTRCLSDLRIPYQVEPIHHYTNTDNRPDITFFDIKTEQTLDLDMSLAH